MNKGLKLIFHFIVIILFISTINLKSLKADELNFGITGVILKEDLVNLINWRNYLSEHSGLKINLKFTRTYNELKNRFKEQQVDFAYVCGATYVDLQAAKNVELLAVPLFESKPSYESLVITKNNAQYKSLIDFKDTLFAFSDPESNSGSLIPQYQLLKQGYNANNFFKKIIYTYDHGESIQAVLDGFVDGASVDSMVYASFIKKNEKIAKRIKIIQRFGPYPIPPIVINKSIDTKIKQKLSTALTDMSKSEDGKLILSRMGIDGFILPKDLSYAKIVKLIFIVESSK